MSESARLMTPRQEEGRGWKSLSAPLLMMCCLLLVTWCLYRPVLEYPFSIFDDNRHIAENSRVIAGLTSEGVRWAFANFYADNWHPLTWISFMVDVELFGLHAGRFHLVNLIIHLANSVLLFLLVRGMTGTLWRSAFVSALFAIHPQHVESVAWISERKDVLSTLFGLLALAGYLHYSRKPRVVRFLPVAAAFLCSLQAKPMLVTLPFVLLLLDYWPLGRWREVGSPVSARRRLPRASFPPLALWLEKTPLILFSLVVSAITLSAQGRSVEGVKHALSLRAANVVVAYSRYVVKAFWPRDLSVLYPYPDQFPDWWRIGGALILLSLITGYSLRRWRNRPYLGVGWLWFLGTLVPVVGIVQVGVQEMADRYTYLPLSGLFVIAGWGLKDLIGAVRLRVDVAIAATLVPLGFLAAATAAQVRVWKDDVTLFRQAVRVTEKNWKAENILGLALLIQGRSDEAAAHLRRSILYRPGYSKSHSNLGIALGDMGYLNEGISELEEALRLNPEDGEAHYNLALLLVASRRSGDAARHYRDAMRIDPALSDAYTNLAQLLIAGGKFDEAERLLLQALELNPEDHLAHNNLGVISQRRGRNEAAAAHYRAALSVRPDDPDARRNLMQLMK